MNLFIITAIVFGLAMLAMSIGVILSNKCIQGSCGNKDLLNKINLESSACDYCDKKEECSQLPFSDKDQAS